MFWCVVRSCWNTVIPATKIVQVDRRHYPLFFFLSLPQKTLYYGGECWIRSYWLKKDSMYSRIVERGVLLPSKRADQISSKGTISVFKDPDSIIILMRACARAYSFPNKSCVFYVFLCFNSQILLKFTNTTLLSNCFVCVQGNYSSYFLKISSYNQISRWRRIETLPFACQLVTRIRSVLSVVYRLIVNIVYKL